MKPQQLSNTLILIIGALILSLIAIIAWYNVEKEESQLIAQNIKYSIDKGIDPLAVRCAYASGGKIDTVCVLYITHHKSKDLGDISTSLIKK